MVEDVILEFEDKDRYRKAFLVRPYFVYKIHEKRNDFGVFNFITRRHLDIPYSLKDEI